MYAKQTLHTFSLQWVHKMMMPAHTLPQKGCCFASASVWQHTIYNLHTLQADNHTATKSNYTDMYRPAVRSSQVQSQCYVFGQSHYKMSTVTIFLVY